VEAYLQLLTFIRTRQSPLVAEEKQIMDLIKVILDNQWLLGEQELF